MKASLVLIAASTVGCQFAARSPDKYRDDTAALLAGSNGAIKACYDGVIAGNKSATGNVTVKFVVASETGKIGKVKVDEANSSAPAPVQECVVNAITGLKIDPPDARDGHATFSFDFEIAPQKQASPKKESGFKAEG